MNNLFRKVFIFFRRRWYLGIILILLIVTLVVRALTPTVAQPTTKTDFNTWKNLIPGFSTEKNVEAAIGLPINRVETENGTKFEYTGPIKSYPTSVQVDSGGKVVLIREQFDPRDQTNVPSFVYSLPTNPDFLLYPDGDFFPLSVYLSSGVAVARHMNTQSVLEIWYFAPMSKEEFVATIGKNHPTTIKGPESARDLEASPSAVPLK